MLQALDAAVRADLRSAAHHSRKGNRRAARARDGNAAQGHAREGISTRRLERRRRRRDDGGVRVIPDDVVERVREEADIVSIIGEFVKLKRVGNSFRGPCPFHHGKNDNFSVTAERRIQLLSLRRDGRRLHVRAEASRPRLRRGGEMGRRQGGRRSARSREAHRRARSARAALGSERDGRRFLPERSCGKSRRAKSRATISRRAPSRARTPIGSGSAMRRATPARCATRSRHSGSTTQRQLGAQACSSTQRGPARAAPAIPRSAHVSDLRRERPPRWLRRPRPRRGRAEVPQLGGVGRSSRRKTLLYGLNWAKQVDSKGRPADHRRGLLRRDPIDARRDHRGRGAAWARRSPSSRRRSSGNTRRTCSSCTTAIRRD